MDPWKPIRLWLCIAVIVALLAISGYARLRWGVPPAPYGDQDWTYSPFLDAEPKTINPLESLERDLWRPPPPDRREESQ
jgi:hypothetical protein